MGLSQNLIFLDVRVIIHSGNELSSNLSLSPIMKTRGEV